MTSPHIAFLRAINVGGRHVKMANICQWLESKPLALRNVQSFLASGNIIFETTPARARNPRTLTRKIEAQLEDELGYRVDVFLRSLEEVTAIVEYQAFEPHVLEQAHALSVMLLTDPLDDSQLRELSDFNTDIDEFHACDRTGTEIYWMCKRKQSESDFSNALFEKRLGVRATCRNIRTFQRLAAKYNAAS